MCLYAMFYPLLAHVLMEGTETGGVGSTPIQALQLLTLVACFVVGKIGKATLRGSIDAWCVGAVYFACASFCLAVFFAENEKKVEIAYAARFIMWFLFAAIVMRGAFSCRQLEKLSLSFLLGMFLQGILAIWAFATHSGESIYKEVYATTGGVYVSGKMIVSFVALGVFLATYWLITRRQARWFYLISILIGCLVVLFSYNRATQLSLCVVILFDGFWLFYSKKIKIVFLLMIAIVVVAAFFTSSFGDAFLLRWQNLPSDGGSGRVKLVRAALDNFFKPESVGTFIFGRGYHQTKELMFQACGAYIGTHSDLLDFLTAYGLVGVLFYLWIALKILTLGRGASRRSIEYLFIRSSALFVILTGLVTGLFQGTYLFFMFFTLCRYWLEMEKLRERQGRLISLNCGYDEPPLPRGLNPSDDGDISAWSIDDTLESKDDGHDSSVTDACACRSLLCPPSGRCERTPVIRKTVSDNVFDEDAREQATSLVDADLPLPVDLSSVMKTRIRSETLDGASDASNERERYLDEFFGGGSKNN